MEQLLTIEELQKQVETLKKALVEEKQKTQQISEQLQNFQQGWSGEWEMDLVLKTVTWSDEMYYLLHVDPEHQPDMRLFKERLSPVGLDKLNGAINRIFVTSEEYSFEHTLHIDNDVLNVRSDLKPVFNKNKMPVKLIGKITDITSTKSAQKEIEKLSIIAAQTSNAVVMLNINAEMDWVNSAFTIMTGYRPDEVKGKLFDHIVADAHDKCCKEIFEEAFKTTYSVIQETQIATKSGSKLWVVVNASPVLDYELNPESYIVIITDITALKKAEQELAQKNKDITDSITYALRIQKAILPHLNEIWKALPQSFVLYKPKDIVAGDFYWFHSPSPLGRAGEGLVLIAAADCTGHGVPGALISMICSEKLNDAVKYSSNPGEILSLANKNVKVSLKQGESKESTKDGMDIALCALELPSPNGEGQGVRLKYAGANRPIWIIRKTPLPNGEGLGVGLEEIKATKKAIGGFTEDDQVFETHIIHLQQGDTFYISSDGYADQDGGDKGKKLMTKTFKQMLIDIQSKSMEEQKEYLENFIENWRADRHQLDDILVIGVRI